MQVETPFKDERKAAYLNSEGADRPLKSPVPDAVLAAARAYRLGRIREQMARADVAGLLLYDPVNIRYAFDSSNMQVWTAHNPTRYALILSDGPAIIFEYIGCEHLAEGLPGVDEVRAAVTYMFLNKGDKAEGFVADWADEICDLVRQHGAGNRRLAVDKLDPDPANALETRGLTLINGTPLTEIARSIKSQDEIELMRWTMRVCEAGMARIYDHSLPGVTEQELWAHLHFENARSGGDWLETKLVTAGPNTNPWFKECSDRPVQAGEMISFDTDMIGPYGYCADLSRSWVCGYQPMTDTQRRLYAASLEQIEHNRELIRPGTDFIEFNEKSWRVPERYLEYRYPACLHGVGLADEWPVLPLYPDWDNRVMSGQFEPGMVICLESLVAEEGSESIKLETQVLVTDTGCEPLDTFPWEEV
ncbi:MAG: Xaa-Pro peptidase family protein [Paracoccaceae bacterium]